MAMMFQQQSSQTLQEGAQRAQSMPEKEHFIWDGPDLDSGSCHSGASDRALVDSSPVETFGELLDRQMGTSPEKNGRCPVYCPDLFDEVILQARMHDPRPQLSQPATASSLESSSVHMSRDRPAFSVPDTGDDLMAHRIERAHLLQPTVKQQHIDIQQEVVLGPSLPDDFLDCSEDSANEAHSPGLQPNQLALGGCRDQDALAQSYKMFQFGSSGYPIPVDSMEHANGHFNTGSSLTQNYGYPNRVDGRDRYSPHQQEKRSQRPCKGKRDRYRKLVLRIQQAIQEDPDGFDLEATELPPSIASNKKLKQKLKKRVQAYTTSIQSERHEGSPARVTLGHSNQGTAPGPFDSGCTKPFQYYASQQLFQLPHRPGMLSGPADANMLPVAAGGPVMSDDHLSLPLRLLF